MELFGTLKFYFLILEVDMLYSLPALDKEAIPLTHFPTRLQAFIFRAYEYFSPERIAGVLRTSPENVRCVAADMGLREHIREDLWLKRGYITVIRRMWHLLPYDQLLELLDTDEESLARLMREEDFLDIKLGGKPRCESVYWHEPREDEKERCAEIKKIVESAKCDGKEPFDFNYSVPKVVLEGDEVFKTRMIYAFSGLYQHAFDVDSEEYLSDEQLKAYKALGINGIWTQGVLSQLTRFPFDESLSAGYEKRIERMRALTERLAKYGIKLYLYLNEPRSLPLEFFERYPEFRGHVRRDSACLCTSVERVREYLRSSIEELCRAVPLIGGFFTITRSENLTNCYSHAGTASSPSPVCSCERCRERSVSEVISELIGTFLEGARRVSPDIKVFAWSWRWEEASEEIIRKLPKEVILLSQSELDMPFERGGVKGNVVDYSMSIVGPGEHAKKEWKIAEKCGIEVGAKVQINTTWEASTVPAIPITPSVEAHMRSLRDEGVKHLLLSWTLGGYPSRNIAAAAKYFYSRAHIENEDVSLRAAEEQFSLAFEEFPFHINLLYNGPQNAGPSNLLFEDPTGYRSTMTCFAYDDIESWRAVYPLDALEAQLERLSEKWQKGLEMLPESDSEGAVMAEAAYCLFASSLNQLRFIRARDDGRISDALTAAKEELAVSEKMLELMNKNAAIGYEAANHYYFSKGQLLEKIVNCHYVIEKFEEKAKEL